MTPFPIIPGPGGLLFPLIYGWDKRKIPTSLGGEKSLSSVLNLWEENFPSCHLGFKLVFLGILTSSLRGREKIKGEKQEKVRVMSSGPMSAFMISNISSLFSFILHINTEVEATQI